MRNGFFHTQRACDGRVESRLHTSGGYILVIALLITANASASNQMYLVTQTERQESDPKKLSCFEVGPYTRTSAEAVQNEAEHKGKKVELKELGSGKWSVKICSIQGDPF